MGAATATWDELQAAYEVAASTRTLEETDASVDTYIAASERLGRELGEDIQPRERSLDQSPGTTGAEVARVQLAGSAAADLEVALRLLGEGTRDIADGTARVDISELRSWGEGGVRGLGMAEDGGDEPDDPETAKELLARRLGDYHGAIADDAAARLADVGGLITDIGIDKIIGAAGKAATAIVAQLPDTVDRVLKQVFRLVAMAIDKLRAFLKNEFGDIETKIADWWKEKIGDKDIVPALVRILLGVDRLTEARRSELDEKQAGATAYNNGGKQLKDLQKKYDDASKLLSSVLSFGRKIWALLATKVPQWAVLVGAVLGLSTATFVVARAGDYIDWENIGPLELPDWIDFVHGPRYVVDRL